MKTKRVIVQLRSDVIKSDLARLGMSARQLAEEVGVKRQYMSAWITHSRNPGPAFRERIHAIMARRMGRSWREIFREVRP